MTQGHRHRSGSAFRSLSLAFALSLLFAIVPLGGAFAQTADEEPDGRFENTVELEAAGAVDAAIAWSQFTFADGSSDTAALGRSDKFPDNLASSLIQGQEDAPLLLTGNEALDDAVAAELERLGVETVHILGGDAALDETVENELEAAGYTVHRDAGVTRIETAIDIARTHAPNATEGLLVRAFGGPSGDETQAWADALAGGAWAADENMPVFLTQTNELNDNLRAYLEDSDITSLTVLGGTAAISEAVVAELEAMGIDVNRVSGSNRFATAIAIAEARGFTDPFDAGSVILIEGQAANAWASGFAAAAYADLSNGVIVLSNGANLPPETQAYLEGADADNDGVNDNADATPDADGDPQLVCGPFVDPEACAAAAAILGYGERTDTAVNASFTDVPELIAAELGRVDEDDDTAIVRFIFDEPIDEDSINENDFVLYQYDATTVSSNDEARRSSADDRAVDVEFDADDVELATTAVALAGAVEDEDGNENIPGSAPLQSVDLAGGQTTRPDLVAVNLDGDDQEVEYVFDEDIETDVVTFAVTDFILIVDPDGDGETDPQRLTADSYTVDDDTVTASFTDATDDVYFGEEEDEDDVVRAIVLENTVQDAEAEEDNNLDQSMEMNEDTNTPTLEDVSIDAEEDEVTFSFSEDISADPTASNFVLYDAKGNTVGTPTFSSRDNNEVILSYAEDTFDDEEVVLAVVEDAAVTDDETDTNEGPQSFAVDGGTFAAGETIAPDLESSSLAEDLDSFGEVQGLELTLDFDEDVDDDDIDESGFTGYEADGTDNTSIIASGDCDVDDEDESIVVCTIDEDEAEDIVVVVIEASAVEDEDNNGNYPVAVGLEGAEDDGNA